MKVAIATDDFKDVTGHVGRCGGFLVLEVEKGKIVEREERPNSFTNHGGGGHGHGYHNHEEGHHQHSHRRLQDALSDCEYLICQSAGWRLVEDLKSVNIKTVFTSVTDAETAAVKLEKGELDMSEEGACHSH